MYNFNCTRVLFLFIISFFIKNDALAQEETKTDSVYTVNEELIVRTIKNDSIKFKFFSKDKILKEEGLYIKNDSSEVPRGIWKYYHPEYKRLVKTIDYNTGKWKFEDNYIKIYKSIKTKATKMVKECYGRKFYRKHIYFDILHSKFFSPNLDGRNIIEKIDYLPTYFTFSFGFKVNGEFFNNMVKINLDLNGELYINWESEYKTVIRSTYHKGFQDFNFEKPKTIISKNEINNLLNASVDSILDYNLIWYFDYENSKNLNNGKYLYRVLIFNSKEVKNKKKICDAYYIDPYKKEVVLTEKGIKNPLLSNFKWPR